jgi:hypothetical protein
LSFFYLAQVGFVLLKLMVDFGGFLVNIGGVQIGILEEEGRLEY